MFLKCVAIKIAVFDENCHKQSVTIQAVLEFIPIVVIF